jgi:4-hydroxybutyrate dehydrogenase
MPSVLKFNAPQIRERFDGVAAYLGIDGGFDGFCQFVDEFNASFAIPKTLNELGVKDPNIDALVDSALRDPSVGGNPVAMTAENTRALYDSVI